MFDSVVLPDDDLLDVFDHLIGDACGVAEGTVRLLTA